jgi:3-isopropylmalate/(R)-2-methylmalate dehydratase small subunit
MTAFIRHEGVAAPFPMDNVDTDVIIPLPALLSVSRTDLGAHAFEALRYEPDGGERADFILNQEPFRRASVLVAGRNFGSGSSREGAVYALQGMGFRVVIASSFGDIFFSNCVKNGVLPVTLDADDVHRLRALAADVRGEAPFLIDLERCAITDPTGRVTAFELDAGLRDRLMAGEDEISLTLHYEREIQAFQNADRHRRRWAWAPLEDTDHAFQLTDQ